MQIKAPRGTYDILPQDSEKWQYIEKIMRDSAESFGFREIRTPLFEHTELFQRGVGQGTDIVSKEMYSFNDRSQRSLTLRPEGTAPCARALIEHGIYSGVMPVKWYYQGPMFRYDRPQTGRYRQFRQFGVEAFGSNSPYLDAEIIILLVEILRRLGLDDYELHLNSLGCSVCRDDYRQKLLQHISPFKEQLCQDCQQRYMQNPLRVLDCKSETCHQAIMGYPIFCDHLCPYCQEHYSRVQAALQDNGISYIHDNNLVRGLDYYSNTAFEIHLPGIGAQSAVGGGGRYDGLVRELGGPEIPGIGFALGMERLLLALDMMGKREFSSPSLDVFVVVMNDAYEMRGLQLVNELRRRGIKTDKDYGGRSGKAQMKYAGKTGARFVVMVGEEEVEKHFWTLRDMQSKEQWQLGQEELIDSIRSVIEMK